MLTEQKKLLERIRSVAGDARQLVDGGVKISGVFQKLRAAGDELETRVRFLTREQARPALENPADAAIAALQSKTKAELLDLVLEHNTTPGNSELVLPESPTKTQIIEALVGLAK